MSDITISVVKGGFILEHGSMITNKDQSESVQYIREVVVSPRKLLQKLKEIIEKVSLVADEKE